MRKKVKNCMFLGLITLMFICLHTSVASATMSLKFSYAGNSFTVSDLDGDGFLVYSDTNSFNNAFTISVTGSSKNTLGSVTSPSMDLLSITIAKITPMQGVLTIELTDTDFKLPGSSGGGVGVIDGNFTSGSAGSVSYSAYYDSDNTPFGQAFLIGSVGPLTSNPSFSGNFSGVVTDPNGNTYSLTQVVTISLDGTQDAISLDATLSVPEPASLTLLGCSLIAAGFGLRIRRRKNSG